MSFIVTPRQLVRRAELYHQLAQLTAAGISLLRALEQLKRNPPDRSFRGPIQQLLNEITQGRPFSEALRTTSGWLPEFDVALIEAGELSGRLDAAFRLLAGYYNDSARVTKQVISQLLYPIALVHLAALVFVIILPFAASQFQANLFLLAGQALLLLAPFYILTGLMLYASQNKRGEYWRARIESLINFIPLLGAARRHLALSRLAVALEALLSAGVNIIEAWDIAAAASGSPALRRAVAIWKPQVVAGRTPSEVVSECPQFPALFANFYSSGEVSGQLDDSLRHLHRYYGDEGTRQLNAFAQWLPRLIYLVVAAVIAYKIIQFWTGYFNQISNITNGF
jgi:type IV pilus assembly protein PilC